MKFRSKPALMMLLYIALVAVSSCEASADLATTASATHDDDEDHGVGANWSIFKTTVKIFNDLDENLDLAIHCMSKDDDLGVHVIPTPGVYSWKFRTNFWGTTLFFCDLSWKSGWGSYVIYDYKRDDPKFCYTKCYWRAGKDGIHGYAQTSPYPDAPAVTFPWTNTTTQLNN
ncbi:S-protein homolog 5-like [Humulus lupulus]|uniref:S-protein homolog 5-like n=1 Tax=Humulus lupulus TaxID=3486 RepID=UPI002B4033E9|nr:S-protein homolog 5-like [Humulus lupulus]